MRHAVSLFAFLIYLAGIVIAKGFWSTFFAIIIPLWSWYLVVEKIVEKYL